jgi:branched-chain amino acid transport system ATP-binding protein
MTDALVIKGLSKRFGGLRAVQDVSFTVKENETVASDRMAPERPPAFI